MSTPAHHASRKKPNTTGKIIGLCLAAVLSFTITGAAAAYYKLQSNVTTIDATRYLEPGTRPTKAAPQKEPEPVDHFVGPLNILVMGTDVRDGDNASLGGEVEGMRSDTTMLVHISADRTRVEIVSIPRDSWVSIPSCQVTETFFTKARTTKFNAAFAYGGQTGDVGAAAACSIKTVEELTGVFIDGYAVVDFSGFSQVVDSLGGVEMDIAEDIHSPKADNLTLTAGVHNLDGYTALQYARARTGQGLGDGSDTGRITRQQELFSAIAEKARTKMTDLPTMYSLLNNATRTVTTSPELSSIPNISGLLWGMKDTLDDENIHFITVPTTPRGDGANVLWTNEADTLWEHIINDTPAITEEPTTPTLTTPTP